MEDNVIWRTNKYGQRFPITNEYMNNKIKKGVKKETFDSIDANNPEEFKQKRKDYINKNLQLTEAASKDETRFRIKAMLDNKIVGTIDYDTKNNKVNIVYVHVDNNYRRSGVATKMYKQLQSEFPNQEIHFGEFTEEGKKLIEKIGTITKTETTEDGFIKYYGKIK